MTEALERQHLARADLDAVKARFARGHTGTDEDWASAKDGLETVLSNLPPSNESAEAQMMREEVVVLWRQLVRKPADPDIVLKYVRDGMNALTPWPNLAEWLESDQTFFLQAIHIQQLVRNAENWPLLLPAGVDRFDELQDRLDEIRTGFDEFSTLWPQLRPWIDEHQQDILEHLGHLLDDAIRSAEQAEQELRYGDALDMVRQGLKLTQARRWSVPLANRRGRLQAIERRIGRLTETKDGFDALSSDLETGRLILGTSAVTARMAAVQSSDESGVRRKLEYLGELQAIAATCTSEPDSLPGLPLAIHDIVQLRFPDPAVIEASWPWLAEQVSLWHEKAVERCAELASRTAQELAEQAAAFSAHPTSDPARLVDLFWQASWTDAELPESPQLTDDLAAGGPAAAVLPRLRSAVEELQQALHSATTELPKRFLEGALGAAIDRTLDAHLDVDERLQAGREGLKIAGQLTAWQAGCRNRPSWVPVTPPLDHWQAVLPAGAWLQQLTHELGTLALSPSERDRNRAGGNLFPLLEQYLGAI